MESQPSKVNYKRRTFVVDKHYQYSTVIRNVLYLLAVSIVLCLPFIHFIKTTSFLVADHGVELQNLIANQMRSTFVAVLLFIVGFIVASAIFTIWRTHKFVGPLKKFYRCMKGVSAGDFSIRVSMRKGDVLIPLADTFNEMVEKLDKKERAKNEALLKHISQAKAEMAKSATSDTLWETLNKLEMEINGTIENDKPAGAKLEREVVSST